MSESGRREHHPDSAFAECEDAPARVRADASERLASELGNRAFGALVSLAGAGIMPDGAVHHEIEAAIARARGGGAILDGGVRDRFAGVLGDPLSDVHVHTNADAGVLARSVQARAFTTGSDLFFAAGEYRPGTPEGDRLLAHELTHVVQQREAPTTGPLRVSDPGDAPELEADTVAQELMNCELTG